MIGPKTRFLAAALAVIWSIGAVAGAPADVLQLKDGRIIEGKKVEQVKGGVKVLFEHGAVFVPKKLIKDVILFRADGTYEAKNAKERAKLEKGLVPFRGKWIPKSQYERKRKRMLEEAKARLEKAKAHRLWRNRAMKSTKNFRFEYTIPHELAKEYMDLFETYYKVFTKHWKIRRKTKQGKLKVCFYHDEETFGQVGAVRGALGYFRFVEPIELNVYHLRNDKKMTIDVIFHEVNHYLFHLLDPKFHYPPWVGEGLAEYYATSEWDPVKKSMKVGNLQESRLISMKDDIDDGEWLGIEEMINMQSATIKHYSWGWSFCHFLMQSKKYGKKFKKMVRAMALARGIKRVPYHSGIVTISPEETFRVMKKYLGVKDLKKLEKEWHGYIQQNLHVKSARGFEAAARMARRNGMPLKAKKFYKKAIEAGGASARCHRSYGDILSDDGKHDEAIKLLEKAVELDPLNPYSHLYLGNALIAKGGKANKERGKKLRKLAKEIDPEDEELGVEFTFGN